MNDRKHKIQIAPGDLGDLRSAFTVIELLVSITVIAVLLALILPAVVNVRETSHRITCANNLKNLSLALINEMETKRRLPLATLDTAPWKRERQQYQNWVVSILPWIDQESVFDQLDLTKPFTDPMNAQIVETHISAFLCPSDISQNGGGDLSFAVNGGIVIATGAGGEADYLFRSPLEVSFDLNGDGKFGYRLDEVAQPNEFDLVFATGLFDRRTRGGVEPVADRRQRGHSPATILDGMSNTLMIAENVRTGFDPATPKSNWGSLDATRMLVTITTDICSDQTCIAGNVNLKKANSGRHAINAGVLLAEGTAPWPNSFHHLGVNAAFADGHVSFISQQIDGEILFNLFTPQGERLRGTPLESSHLTTSF